MATQGAVVGGYVHNNGSYAALVTLEATPPLSAEKLDAVVALSHSIAQHVVAMDPDSTLTGPRTPEAAVKALMVQPYVLDAKATVAALLKRAGKTAGSKLVVADFVRWACGGK